MKKNARLTLKQMVAQLCLIGLASQTTAAETPNAGTLQQQINPPLPASPSPEGVELPTLPDSAVRDETPFMVNRLSIEGNQSIATETLFELIRDYQGSTHTINDLQGACRRITEYYRAQGFPFARAVLPQQEITDGEVKILVIEARYGSINLNNNSAVSDAVAQRFVSPLQKGEAIAQQTLDRSLLLLSDLPGVTTAANIKPGKAVGESDFDISLQDASRLTGRAGLDNFGNKFINRPRAMGSLVMNNPLHHGDVLNLTYLTTGERMQYAQLSYDWLLNGAGTRIGAAYAHLYYKLGENLQRLDIHGTSDNTELWIRHPWLRSRTSNLYLNLRYQHNVLKDRTDAASIKNDRTLNNAILGVNGDVRDSLLGGGVNSYQVAYTLGDVGFDNTNARTADGVSANTRGRFAKLNYNINRLQNVTDRIQLWGSVTGQVAEDNLDASQKMVFGGPYSVRAYDNGTVSGDNGTLITLEARYLIGQWHGSWQGIAFYDAGSLQVNEKRWPANTGKNQAHLAGAGVGINWVGPGLIQARAFVATSTSQNNALTKDGDSNIGWVEFAKYF